MHRLYHLHILHYHFALCTFITHTHTHTHTSTRPLSCTTHPHKHKNIIYFFLHYPHQLHKITFLLDIDTVKIIALSTIGPVSGNTLCENVLPMCMYICSPYVYVYMFSLCMSVRCISVYV